MSKSAKVSGSVVAGFPSPAEQYQETPLDLNELLVKRPAATFFVKVQGESMIGAGIHDGDLLVVDRSLRPSSGDVIIACVDGDFTVKTLRLGNRERNRPLRGFATRGEANTPSEASAEGTGNRREIRLEPANPNFPVIVLKPGQELDYFGKVTACIHRF